MVSGVGFWAKALDFSGFLAAIFVGAAIFWGAGFYGAAVLIFFFLTGSVLARLPSKIEFPGKKAKRDWKQVLANGLWAAILALLYGFKNDEIYYLACVSTLAVACADTVGGEIGLRRAKKTISLANLRTIPPGLSGGVSLAGTIAGLIGAVLLGMVGVFSRRWDLLLSLKLIALISLIGFLGSLFDSVLGAWLQAKYRCSVCKSMLEVPVHCGRPTLLSSGLGFLGNDRVNFLATLFGALMALILF